MRVGRAGSRTTIRPERSTNMTFAGSGINRVTSVRRVGAGFGTTKAPVRGAVGVFSSVWSGHISYIGAKQDCGHPGWGGRSAAIELDRDYGRNVGTAMFRPVDVNVAVAPFGVWAVNVSVASSSVPACTPAFHATRFVRIVGGPGGRPARAGQMISSTLPAASVASTTPGSAGTGTISAPNVSGPPGIADVFVPANVTLTVPEGYVTLGTALVEQPPIAFTQPSGTSPTRSMRRRPVRNCGTVAETSDSAPPSPSMFAHGSVGVIVSVAVRETAPAVAVTMALVPTVAGGVVTVNVAVVAPAATVTDAGTDADAGTLLAGDPRKPPAG